MLRIVSEIEGGIRFWQSRAGVYAASRFNELSIEAAPRLLEIYRPRHLIKSGYFVGVRAHTVRRDSVDQ